MKNTQTRLPYSLHFLSTLLMLYYNYERGRVSKEEVEKECYNLILAAPKRFISNVENIVGPSGQNVRTHGTDIVYAIQKFYPYFFSAYFKLFNNAAFVKISSLLLLDAIYHLCSIFRYKVKTKYDSQIEKATHTVLSRIHNWYSLCMLGSILSHYSDKVPIADSVCNAYIKLFDSFLSNKKKIATIGSNRSATVLAKHILVAASYQFKTETKSVITLNNVLSDKGREGLETIRGFIRLSAL